MTREWNGYGEPTPFSHWFRGLGFPLNTKNFSNQNIDFSWQHFRDHWLILIEEKRFGGGVKPSQEEAHSIVNQLLRNASGSKVKTWYGDKTYEYRGLYYVVFEKTHPHDSAWVKIGESPNTTICYTGEYVLYAVLSLLETGDTPDPEALKCLTLEQRERFRMIGEGGRLRVQEEERKRTDPNTIFSKLLALSSVDTLQQIFDRLRDYLRKAA